MPILSAEVQPPGKTTLGLVSDPRVTQYWDSKAELSRMFPAILGFPRSPASPAWDVFLLFDGDAEWTAQAPPKPVYWMHQLAKVPAHVDIPFFQKNVLDGPQLAAGVRLLLQQGGPRGAR